ncbi:MAG: hypothetical protein KA715_13355 [Xanthomonadaceae bacterium]|nr:hypothetical protein [Xanthomonadaceae bacterium]
MKGQALIEFMLSCLLLAIILAGALNLFRNSFLSLQCHIQAFESGRRMLNEQLTEEIVTETRLCNTGRMLRLEFRPLEQLFGAP